MPNRMVARLRSRKLAALLIAALAVFSIMGTFVPRGPLNSPKVAAWIASHPGLERIVGPLGLHHAYTTPFFLLLAAMLMVSTTACAYERSRSNLAIWRRMRAPLSPGTIVRLERNPDMVIVPAHDEMGDAELLATVGRELTRAGHRISVTDDSVDASAGRWGLLGSPLFHWSLVALMVLVAAGTASRAEGTLTLPLDTRVADAHGSYSRIVEGPLFGESHTGIEFRSTGVTRHYTLNGVDYGAVPTIVASRNGADVASGTVRPNSPLRIGSLTVHSVSFGPAVLLAIETSTGAEIGRQMFTLEKSTLSTSGTEPQVFALSAPGSARQIKGRVQVLTKAAPGSSPTESRALIELDAASLGGVRTRTVVPVNQSVELPGGMRLTVLQITDWAKVSVANDWSVPFIYATLIVAIAGLAVSILVSARSSRVLLVQVPTGRALHVATWHARKDPSYRKRIASVVTLAVNGEVPE